MYLKVKVCQRTLIKLILLQAFTAGCKLGWILRLCWFVNVPMNVLAVVIEGGTGVHWRIVMLKAFIWILRNPKTKRMYQGNVWEISMSKKILALILLIDCGSRY